MINRKNQHYQVKPSKRFDDEFSAGSALENSALSLEDDLNAIRTQIKRITGRDNWYDNSNFPSNTDLNSAFESSQKTWSTIFADTGSTSPDRRKDTFVFSGGYGVGTQVSGKSVFLTGQANYYSTYKDNSNSVSPASETDTLRIVGLSPNITTTAEEVDGDKRIVVDYSGPGRQDLWFRFYDDDGSSIIASSPADILEIVGEDSIQASISGKTLTLSYSQGLDTSDTPTFAGLEIDSLNDNGVIFVDENNFLVNDPDNFYFDFSNNRLGIGSNSPDQNLHIQDGNLKHNRESAVTLISTLSDTAIRDVKTIRYYKGFLFLTNTGFADNRFYSISVLDESTPAIASYIEINDTASDSSVGGIAIAGKYAYVCKGTTLHVIDIEDPYNMSEVGFLSPASNDLQIPILFGNILFCIESDLDSDSGTTIHIVDISNPVSPVLLYSDTTLSDYDRVSTGLIRNNRLYLIGGSGSGTGKEGLFDLTDIESNLNFTNRVTSERNHTYGTQGPNSILSVGNAVYVSNSSRSIAVSEILGDIDYLFDDDLGEVSGSYYGLIRGGSDSLYLLRDEDIVTVRRNSNNTFESMASYSEPNGYDAICGDFHANRLYVYHQEVGSGRIAIYQGAFDFAPLVEAQRAVVDVLESRNLDVEQDATFRDSLNIGPEGIFVDQGHGISIDGELVAQGKVGLGVGNPEGDLHIGGGRLYHRPNTSAAISLDAIPYTPSAIFSNGNLLYVSSESNENISVWDVTEPNELKEIQTISLSGATFPANIVVTGKTICYAKSNNEFGLTRLVGDNSFSYSLELDSGAIIYQIITDNKYAYIASNGTSGQSIYIVDISDPASLNKISEWKVTGFSNPTNGIEIGFMHKNGDVIYLFGSSPLFTEVIYNIDVSDIYNPTSLTSSTSSNPTATSGYSISDTEFILAKGSSIERRKSNYSSSGSVLVNSGTNSTGTAYSFIVLGQTLYVGGATGISLYDIGSLSSSIVDFTALGTISKKNSIAVTKRNLFAINNSDDLAYLDLKTYQGTSVSAGVIESDFMSSDSPIISKNFWASGLEVNRVLGLSEIGITSYSDLSVLNKMSIMSSSENSDCDVYVQGKDIRHKSFSLYDENENTLTDLNTNTIKIKYWSEFLYSLSVGSTNSSLHIVSIDSPSSPEVINSINLGSTLTYEPVDFCFSGVYCYVVYSDGKLSIFDISHPAGIETILNRGDIGETNTPISIYVRSNDLYIIDDIEELLYVNVSDPENPVFVSTTTMDALASFIVPSNNDLVVVYTDGSATVYDITEGSPSAVAADTFDFGQLPIDVKSYGDMIFCLYNSSGSPAISAHRRTADTVSTLTFNSDLSEPISFEIFENGFVVLTDEEVAITQMSSGSGFSGSTIDVGDTISLPSGSDLSGIFLALSRERAYVLTAIVSKLYSYNMGQLELPSIRTDNLSAFNAEIRSLESLGSLGAHSITVGPGGLNVASSNGIRVDGDLIVAGNSVFGSNSLQTETLSLIGGNLAQIKPSISSEKDIALPVGDTNAVISKGEYVFAFGTEDIIYCYRSEEYESQTVISSLSIDTADFKDAAISGNYLYFLNGDTFNSTLNIVDISNPEQIQLKSSKGWDFETIEQLQFYDMSKLLVVGNLLFIVSQTQKDSILVLDISDKTNVRYIKTISDGVFDIVDMATNGSYVFAASRTNKLIHWISIDKVLEDDLYVPLRLSGTGILSDPVRCKVYDNILFVLNDDASNSIIDIFETVGEVKTETYGFAVFESGDFIGQIELSEGSVRDFFVGSEELIISSNTAIRSYHMLRDYVIYPVGSYSVSNVTSIEFYKDQIRAFEAGTNNFKILKSDSFDAASIYSSSSSIRESIIRGNMEIFDKVISYPSISVGGFGFESKGDIVVKKDLFCLGGLGVGSLEKDYDIYFNDRSIIIERNKTPQTNGTEDMTFVSEVISSSDFYIPDPDDDDGSGSSDGGPSTPTDIMDGPKACKRVGNYLYVIANDGGINNEGSVCVIDISNPKAPIFSGAFQDDEVHNLVALDVQNSHIYAVSSTVAVILNANRKELIYTVSGVGSGSFTSSDFPFDTSDQTVLNNMQDVLVSGRYMFIACNDTNFLTVLDVEDPSNIKIAAVANNDEIGGSGSLDADNLYIDGNRLYVSIHGESEFIAVFDITQIDKTPSMQPIALLSVGGETIDSPTCLTSSERYFYVIDSTQQKIYLLEIIAGTLSLLDSISDSEFSYSFAKISAKEDYLYVLLENSFRIYKVADGALILWADYDTSQNPTGVGTFTDMEIAGRYAYITDEEYNRVLVIDMHGLVAEYVRAGSFSSYDMCVQQGLRGNGAISIDGNVFVGNSLLSSGTLSTSIVQTKSIGQGSESLTSPIVFGLNGSIDVGDSLSRIPSDRIFEQASMTDAIGAASSCVVNKDVAYVSKSNKLYAIDLSSETPNYLGEIQKDGSSFVVKSFSIVNDEIFIVEHDSSWKFSHYTFKDIFRNIDSSEDTVSSSSIFVSGVNDLYDVRIENYGKYVIVLGQDSSNEIKVYVYDTFSQSLVHNLSLGTFGNQTSISASLNSGILYYSESSGGQIGYVDLRQLPSFDSISSGILATMSEGFLSSMVVFSDWMYVSVNSDSDSDGKIRAYKIQVLNVPVLTLSEEIGYDGSASSSALIACPDPLSMAVVGDVLFVVTGSNEVSVTDNGDYAEGLCAFRLNEGDGSFEFLYKIDDFDSSGTPLSVLPCDHFLAMSYYDNPNYSFYMIKPTTAKTMGARFQTVSAKRIKSQGSLHVTGKSIIDQISATGNISTRGEVVSDWGLSGQTYGYRRLQSSIEIAADQTYNFEDIIGVSYEEDVVGQERGIARTSSQFVIYKSGKYELVFSGSINHDTVDSTVVFDFNGSESFSTTVEANKYTPITVSSIFEIELGESTDSNNMYLGISISGGSSAQNFRVAKGSSVLLKKIG